MNCSLERLWIDSEGGRLDRWLELSVGEQRQHQLNSQRPYSQALGAEHLHGLKGVEADGSTIGLVYSGGVVRMHFPPSLVVDVDF
jgi:hypothetical protein